MLWTIYYLRLARKDAALHGVTCNLSGSFASPYPHPFPADSGPNTFPRGCYQNTLQGKTLPPRPDITSTIHPPPSPQYLLHLLPNQALPLPPLLRLARTRPAALRGRSQRPKHALRLGYLAVCAL